jgi:hypothetical protein
MNTKEQLEAMSKEQLVEAYLELQKSLTKRDDAHAQLMSAALLKNKQLEAAYLKLKGSQS